MSEPATSGPGLRLKGRYVIQKELGRGGIGVVYLAHDEQLHSRPVVIKVLLDQTAGTEWFQKHFLGEIEALVRIDHPGVVGALDAGEMPDGKPFLVMQYVPGGNLRSMMKAGLLELPAVADVVRQVGSALSAAHDAGVHHRDLKPENIMVKDQGHGERQVKIIDFGIATVRDPAEAGTQMTQVAGSVLYMAPEQLVGRPGAASDIYALARDRVRAAHGAPALPAQLALRAAQHPARGRSGEAVGAAQRPLGAGRHHRAQGPGPGAAGPAPHRAAAGRGALRRAHRGGLPRPHRALAPFDGARRHRAAADRQHAHRRAPAHGHPAPAYGAARGAAGPRPRLPRRRRRQFHRRPGPAPGIPLPYVAIGGVVLVAAVVIAVVLLRKPPAPVPTPTAAAGTPTPPPAPAAAGPQLAYYLTVQKYQDGKPYRDPFRLSKEMLFGPQDRLRVSLAAEQPGFLYIVNEGPGPAGGITYNVLHPKTTVAGGSAALAPGGEVHVPSAQSYFAFDEAQGTETLWLVFATEQVPELEAVKGAANPEDRGVIKDPARLEGLRAFLDRHRAEAPERTQDDGARRTVLRSSKPVLVSPLKLEHS